MIVGTVLEGTITALSFGGEGILRHEGYVLFVPYTAIGDQVRVRVVETKMRFGRAVVGEIISPGEGRCIARCPYFGQCGGCQLQHLNATQQLNAKVQWLQDALARIGHLSWTLKPRAFPATENWFYRRHIRLTLKPGKGYQIGYHGAQSNTFVPIQQCALFLPQEDPLFVRLERLLAKVTPPSQENGALSLMKLGEQLEDSRFFAHYTFPQVLSKEDRLHLLHHWQCDRRLVGMAIETPRGRECLGESVGSFSLNGLKLTFSPFAFVQAHPAQSALLYDQVKAIIQRLSPSKILDLYCGIGVTSLVCALNGARVVGVEGNAEAIACAQENRKRNAIGNVEFLCADVTKVCETQLSRLSPDLVLVNPPRTGLAPKVCDALLKHPPRALIYISCMPATLARDLNVLAKKGFASPAFVPTECAVFDLFPQTTHMETLLLLER